MDMLIINTVSVLRNMAKRLRSGDDAEAVAKDLEGLADVLAESK